MSEIVRMVAIGKTQKALPVVGPARVTRHKMKCYKGARVEVIDEHAFAVGGYARGRERLRASMDEFIIGTEALQFDVGKTEVVCIVAEDEIKAIHIAQARIGSGADIVELSE